MFGISTLSSWNKERFARRRRENGVAESSFERMERMKRGQRVEATCWKERRSRPECFERESYTADRKRVCVSRVSFSPLGRGGEGGWSARIRRSSALV